MQKTKITSAILICLTFAMVTFAHGNFKHVLGTVTNIADGAITVQTQDGQSQVVKIAPDTEFVKSGASASIKDLKVGDRVVIHAKPVGDDLIAHEVRFGKPPATPAAAPKAQ